MGPTLAPGFLAVAADPGAGSGLDGAAIGAVEATAVAVRPAAGGVEAIPRRSRPLAADETLYLVARPERLRAVSALAAAAGADAADEATP